MHLINGFTYKELFSLAIEKPILAQLEITRNCNQKCSFCFNRCTPKQRFPDKSLINWKKAIDKLTNVGVCHINFSGGEIFLYPHIIELFRYAKERGIKTIVVNTNGTVDLSRYNLQDIDEIVFSIHGIKNDHDIITGFPGAFDKVTRSLQYVLSKDKYHIGINTVITSDNINKMKEIFTYFKKLPVQYHSFNVAIDRHNLQKKAQYYGDIIPQYINFLESIPKSKLKLRHGVQNIFIHDRSFFKSKIPLPHCAGGKYKMSIDYEGNIYPCVFFQDKQHYCGNIFKDDLREVWKTGKGFRLFRKVILEDPLDKTCEKCFKREKCKGGCLAWRIYNNKSHTYGKDIRCEFGNAYLGA